MSPRRSSRKLLGAPVSTQGGLHNAPERGRSLGADVIQIFTRKQLQWAGRSIDAAKAAAFRDAMRRSGLRGAIAHASYLLNLASPDPGSLRRSRAAFLADMERCRRLRIGVLVFHPGASLDASESQALRTVARSLDLAVAQGPAEVDPVIEVSAGQGSCIGHRLEHLEAILDASRRPERIGVCLDTCTSATRSCRGAAGPTATPRSEGATCAARAAAA